ncbi:uncharacterized protein HD556DRAFT_1458489 [Suillus plorans]|uniref:Uncharacterized protein n=1 Tax=Suillus plorans TaxID=116603 RepID=A0A9P7AB93_9AGAM|nr:uncharacterized protein HD556DRAFT_1458489 [Suillus plorans]KAG1785458.1 hypothetical protein HD556DRAFT_1458489 [Suillus plorans]
MHFDEAWCPVCDRQIRPKVLPQPQEPTPVPTPSPVSSSPSKNQQSDSTACTSRIKIGAGRAKNGCLQGTGCVKPNGAIKQYDSAATAHKGRASPSQPQQPVAPVKHRTIIDQGPIPLYCSDECRLQDLAKRDGVYPLNHHPDRSSPPLPRVPHNSFEGRYCESEDESTSASGSSFDSGFTSSSPLVTVSRSMATLAALYNFPPLPSVPPMSSPADSTSSSLPEYRNDYQGGTMMASKRIQEILCQPHAKPSSFYSRPPQPRKPVPGWTDGGSEWRQSVYGGYSTRSDNASGGSEKAQTSFAATSRRRVQWTSALSQSNSSSALAAQCPTSSLPPPQSGQSDSEELYTKYSLPLSRRHELHMSLFPHSASSSAQSPPLSSTSTSLSCRRRREVPLLKRGAEGRLLVPDVRLAKPLRRHPSKVSQDSILSDTTSESLSPSSRPAPQTRTWSYDNIKTYPVMMPPAKKEKHIEHRMVDGEVEEVEVEVEVVQPLRRLFLFPGKDTTFVGRS